MAESVTVVPSGGVLVTESLDNTGVPLTPTDNARPVTIGSGGPEVTFISIDGILWPGGVSPSGTLIAGGGSYAWTGQDASLVIEAPASVAAGAGSYAWTGDTMTALQDHFVTAAGGSYTWTGQDATLTVTGGSLGLQTSLGSFFSLDNTLADAVGAVTDLTNNNTVTFVSSSPTPPSAVTNSAKFVAASSQYLSHADDTGINVAGIDFSIQAWVYATSNSSPLFNKSTGAFNSREFDFLQVFGSNFLIRTNINNGTSFDSGQMSTSAWHHIVMTWNNTTRAEVIYVDGASSGTGTGNKNPAGTSTLHIGTAATPGTYFGGNMCLFGIWRNRILSGPDVTALYNGGAGLSYAAMA